MSGEAIGVVNGMRNSIAAVLIARWEGQLDDRRTSLFVAGAPVAEPPVA